LATRCSVYSARCVVPAAHPRPLVSVVAPAAPAVIHTLSLHDALPICSSPQSRCSPPWWSGGATRSCWTTTQTPAGSPCSAGRGRSEEHTSELQSRADLVCRLLLEKKRPQTEGKRCCHAWSASGQSLWW